MARQITGYLFKRGRRFWLAYQVNGEKIRQPLKDEAGNSITTKAAAEIAKDRVLRPYQAKDEEQRRQLAFDALRTAQEITAQAEELANPPLKIADAWQKFHDSPDRPDCGPRTLNDYAGYWRAFVSWLYDQFRKTVFLRDITPDITQAYAAYLTKTRQISANTFNKYLFFLKMLCRILAEPARLAVNPFDKIVNRKLKTESRRELTIEELYRILDTAEGDLALLLGLGTFTGLRMGDCCTLKWGEIDLIKQIIRRVPRKTVGSHPQPVLIGIPGPLLARLKEIPPAQRKGYLLPDYAAAYIDHNARTALVERIQRHFKTCGIETHKEGTGVNIDPETGRNIGKRAVVEVGFHSLRHTYVSLHAMHGTPAAIIQAIVGHGNPAMTEHYTHIDEAAARKAAAALNLPAIAERPAEQKPGEAAELQKAIIDSMTKMSIPVLRRLQNYANMLLQASKK